MSAVEKSIEKHDLWAEALSRGLCPECGETLYVDKKRYSSIDSIKIVRLYKCTKHWLQNRVVQRLPRSGG